MPGLTPKPLWGFGWAGWCLLIAALSLAAMMLAGVNIRHWIMARIHLNLGWDATVWFVIGFIHSHGMFDFRFMPIQGSGWSDSPPDTRFSVITMCLTLIALQVHPRRTGVVRIMGVVVIGLFIPSLTMTGLSCLTTAFADGPAPAPRISSTAPLAISFTISAAVTILAMRWITRSATMGAVTAAFLVVGTWLTVERDAAIVPSYGHYVFRVFGNETWFRWMAWGWNPLFFACLLAWAIRARPKAFPLNACQLCGYDLRGTPARPCPECGAHPPQTSLPATVHPAPA